MVTDDRQREGHHAWRPVFFTRCEGCEGACHPGAPLVLGFSHVESLIVKRREPLGLLARRVTSVARALLSLFDLFHWYKVGSNTSSDEGLVPEVCKFGGGAVAVLHACLSQQRLQLPPQPLRLGLWHRRTAAGACMGK